MDQISNTFSLAVQLTFASTNEQPDDNDTSIKQAKKVSHKSAEFYRRLYGAVRATQQYKRLKNSATLESYIFVLISF